MNTNNCLIILTMALSCSINAQYDVKIPTDSIEIIYDGNYGLSIVKNISNEKFGVIDSIGNFVLPPQYDYVFPFFDELALVYNDDKCGYINLKGNIEIPFEYTTGNHFKNGKAIVTKQFIYGVIDKSNNILIPFKYEVLQTHDHTFYNFQLKPGESGLMDSQEQITVEPIYEHLVRKNDSLWIGKRNKKFTILKNNGDLHCLGEFDQIGRKNSANLLRFSIDNKVGFLDEQFNIIISAQYKNSGPNIGQLIAVSNGKKWGFIDKSNTLITGFVYDKVKGLNNESCIVIREGISNIIDKNGKLRLEKGFNYIQRISKSDLIFMDGHLYNSELNKKTIDVIRLADGRFSGMENGMMKVYIDNKLGYVDSLGSIKILPNYDNGDHFYEDKCTAVKKDGKWGFIKSNNEFITEMTYDSVSHFGSFLKCKYLIVKDGLYGYFSGDKVVFEPQFQEIIIGEDQSLIYRKDNKFGIIDEQNNELNPPMYDKIRAHVLGYEVEKAGKYGFIDKSLNIIIPIEYEYLEHAGFYLIAQLNGKFGTISEANEIIQDFVYDKIERKPFDIIRTDKEEKVGTLSSVGTELLPPIYDKIRKVNWKNIEVSIGGKSEIINTAKLEMENATKNKKR